MASGQEQKTKSLRVQCQLLLQHFKNCRFLSVWFLYSDFSGSNFVRKDGTVQWRFVSVAEPVCLPVCFLVSLCLPSFGLTQKSSWLENTSERADPFVVWSVRVPVFFFFNESRFSLLISDSSQLVILNVSPDYQPNLRVVYFFRFRFLCRIFC